MGGHQSSDRRVVRLLSFRQDGAWQVNRSGMQHYSGTTESGLPLHLTAKDFPCVAPLTICPTGH